MLFQELKSPLVKDAMLLVMLLIPRSGQLTKDKVLSISLMKSQEDRLHMTNTIRDLATTGLPLQQITTKDKFL